MNYKKQVYGVIVAACLCSLFSVIYLTIHYPEFDSSIDKISSNDRSFEEKSNLPEVEFVVRVIKTIFESADFK
ncbi:MAG TPA: hypothetical protein PK047_09650 [Saprospiraceae bacterium]|nr:hypothetical protein [Saprospiraceae bacterium]HRO09120.1 hypothetical protein [Saprospiraceae bacterium]HRP42466.1 hypothetical protein [Saprospiraceae bacterium]